MDRKDFRIVFMGTPSFAIPSLEILRNTGYDIVAVVTAPDRPAGRGLKLQQSPVKAYALTHHLPLLQPEKMKEAGFRAALQEYAPHLIVVVAFRMLPKEIWQLPEYGTINLHASLLPQYRGAAPIHWAVMNGEETTGVTTFYINEAIDTGDVLLQEEVAIGKDMDTGQLHEELEKKGAQLLLKTIDEIRKGSIHPQSQEEWKDVTSLKRAPKLARQHCEIDWNKPAKHIYNMIRGLRPYPGAYTHITLSSGKRIEMKVWKGKVDNTPSSTAGSLSVHDQRLMVSCKDACIELVEIQPAGKQRMDAASFLRGASLPNQTL